MDEEERYETIRYGIQASTSKEVEFIHIELAEQVHSGHVAVLPLEAVTSLKNLWLSYVAVTPKAHRLHGG